MTAEKYAAFAVAAVASLILGTAMWVRRLLTKTGTLAPLQSGTAKQEMRGWCLPIGSANTHYAIFSKSGAWGQGSLELGNLVVFVHGLGAQLDQLTWGVDGGFAQNLVDAGFTVLALDVLGHGFSDAPDTPLKPQEYIAQLEALFSHLDITKPFDLIGFSMGCFIAAAYSVEHPSMVKCLVLSSPFGCDLPFHSWRPVAALAASCVSLFFEGNMSHMRTIYRTVLHWEGFRLTSIIELLGSTSVDVAIVAGSLDCDPAMRILQTARRIHSSLPKSKLHVVPGGVHMTWALGPPSKQRSLRGFIISFLRGSCTESSWLRA